MPTRTIAVLSGKGGVGKTTFVLNTAYSLSLMENKVLAIDANTSTPDLSINSGIYLPKYTLSDIVKGNAEVENSIIPTYLEFDLIAGTLSEIVNYNKRDIQKIFNRLDGKYDFVLVDCPAGLGNDVKSILSSAEEVIIVSNPDLPSITSALKSLNISKKLNKLVDCIVVNRVNYSKFELSKEKIFDILDFPDIFFIPEDKNIAKANKLKQPIVKIDANSKASKEILKIASFLCGREYKIKQSFLDTILRAFNF